MTTMTTAIHTTTMPKPAQSGTAAAGTGSVQTLTALTTTTTTTKPTAGRKIAKWSGEDEPSEYRRRGEDTDTIRLTVGEQRRLRCIYINAQRKWHDADTDE